MLAKLADDLITVDEYRLFAQSIESEKQVIENELAEPENITAKGIDTDVLKKLHLELEKAMNFETLTTETLNRFIAKIDIKEDGTPRVYYRFADFI